MNTNPISVKEESAVLLSGAGQSGALGPAIRMLVWNVHVGECSTLNSYLTELCADQDLVMYQQQNSTVSAPADCSELQDERYKWLTADSRPVLHTEVCVGVNTGCVVAAEKHVQHESNQEQNVEMAQYVLLETHYALAASNHTLMVLNLCAIQDASGEEQLLSFEPLKQTLTQHEGAIIVAGEFDAWSQNALTDFQQCMIEAELFNASMTRSNKEQQTSNQLGHVFYRGLNLHSVESLPTKQSAVHAPITASFVIE